MAGKRYIRIDVELLEDLYRSGKTTRQIAEETGVSYATVGRRLHAAGVEMRVQGPEHISELRDKSWLADMYVTKGLSSEVIARQIGASPKTVVAWLERHGIDRRPRNQHAGRRWSEDVRKRMSEAKKGRNIGPDNPNWRGAKVHPDKRLRAQYKTKEWSKAVRARDGNKCVKCCAVGRLHAHHIQSWKEAPSLRYEVSNGMTLCPHCHQKEHGWRFPSWAYHGEGRTSATHAKA